MQTVVLNIHDESKTALLLGLLRDLRYVDICEPVQEPTNDVYAGLPSKLDEDILQSQIDVLAKVEW